MSSTLTNLIYHAVFSTKDRYNLIRIEFEEELHSYICGIIKGEDGSVIRINGTADHLHILLKCPAKISFSDMMRKIKGNSSKWLNEGLSAGIKFGWQNGYGAFSVSESIVPRVSEYIINQKAHHRNLSFKEEFILLLEKNKVKYDEQYLWD